MIKLFKEKDNAPILSIWEKSVVATHDFLSSEDLNFYKSLAPEFLSKSTIYIFEEENIVKGFLGVSDVNIDMLFVNPKYIGKGSGKLLLFYAINELRLTRVNVNEQNTNALDFYKHFGFEIIGRDDIDGFGKPYPIVHLKMF